MTDQQVVIEIAGLPFAAVLGAACSLLFDKPEEWEVVRQPGPEEDHVAVLLVKGKVSFVIGRAGYDRASSENPERTFEQQLAILEERAELVRAGTNRKQLATAANRTRAEKLLDALHKIPDNPQDQEGRDMT